MEKNELDNLEYNSVKAYETGYAENLEKNLEEVTDQAIAFQKIQPMTSDPLVIQNKVVNDEHEQGFKKNILPGEEQEPDDNSKYNAPIEETSGDNVLLILLLGLNVFNAVYTKNNSLFYSSFFSATSAMLLVYCLKN